MKTDAAVIKWREIISMILIGLLFSCNDDSDIAGGEFRIIVESQCDISCGLPVVTFLDNPLRVKEKTSLEELTYNAHRLDNSLNIEGKVLIIRFTTTAPEDLRPCKAIGIWYPCITVLDARPAK